MVAELRHRDSGQYSFRYKIGVVGVILVQNRICRIKNKEKKMTRLGLDPRTLSVQIDC